MASTPSSHSAKQNGLGLTFPALALGAVLKPVGQTCMVSCCSVTVLLRLFMLLHGTLMHYVTNEHPASEISYGFRAYCRLLETVRDFRLHSWVFYLTVGFLATRPALSV